MDYHVLSKGDLITIFSQGSGFCVLILMPIFIYLANRDSHVCEEKKSMFRKIIPWLVLLIFLSAAALLATRLLYYPWNVEAQPSQGSIYREMQHFSDEIPFYGWANDYQLPLLSSFCDAILWFCWTIYAFQFKPSPTSWKKKMCKVFAYIILSISIIGFNIHYAEDLGIYAILLFVIVILLWVAHVKPEKQDVGSDDEISVASQKTIESDVTTDNESPKKEDYSRFMPNVAEMAESNVLSGKEIILQEAARQQEIEESKQSECTLDEASVIDDGNCEENSLRLDKSKTVPFDMMYCKHCGKIIESDSKFCKYCGKSL